ncbi:MAG: tRNA pseudouridine(55) synthase TruB [Woeseiaceae bacterium]|nr:tRNA pseudouridine(55) synthase TruB [Woeseiaceae bacterium]
MVTGTGKRGGQKPVPVNGLLLLNKPAGMTSNQALQRVKRLLNAKKAGHTGSLDPAATGMLPLCFGEATKVCAYLLDEDKSYRVTARLGEKTDTGDGDGTVIDKAEVPGIGTEGWKAILTSFEGEIEQVPPMYSALKKDGKRLYELARKGETVERAPRPVVIHEINMLEHRGQRLVLQVRCSKGTYVRTLVEDVAAAAGTVAYTARLHRDAVGRFRAEDMLDLAQVEELALEGPDVLRSQLLSADTALTGWDACQVANGDDDRFSGGQTVVCDVAGEGRVRVYGPDGRFLGVGELIGGQTVKPRRIFLPAGEVGCQNQARK